MPFALTDEQKLLQESVDRFVERDYGFDVRTRLAESENGWSAENWARFAELGWLGVPFDEAAGGYGGGPVEAGLIAEGLGKGLAVEPYLWTVVLGGGLLARAGRNDLLEELIAGGLQLATGFAEPQARYALHDVATKAECSGSDYVLTGQKAVVFNAPSADRLIVPARTAGGQTEARGITLFLLPADADGIALRPYRTMDDGRAAEVTLANVRAGADAVLGEVDDGMALLKPAIDVATAVLCCEAAGVMQALVSQTREYIGTRKQFGVPLSSFQVLQHRMAEMFIHKEQTQSMAYMAVVRAAAGDGPVAARAASAAKAYAGEKGKLVGQEAIQMHGGMGMTREMPISSFFKRITMIGSLFGDADHHLDRFAGLAGGRAG
ncbi:MAG: acyl-CoA dehydrogenase [Rhodospirillaceae bacterium]|nr:acyl-CoA dehydrogenase [Rhodospirillaceae bacterium]